MNSASESTEMSHTIKLAYLAGADVPELAARYGISEACLRKRITRQGWAAEKQRLAHTVAERTIQTCESVGERTKARIAACTENIVAQLSSKTPQSADALHLHTDTLLKATKIGQVVHGWGESPNVAVVIAGVQTIRAEPDEEPAAIDVESV